MFYNQENLIQSTEPDSVQVSTKDMDSTLSKASRAIKKTSKKVRHHSQGSRAGAVTSVKQNELESRMSSLIDSSTSHPQEVHVPIRTAVVPQKRVLQRAFRWLPLKALFCSLSREQLHL